MENIFLFGNARFTVITENLIRCEYAKDKNFAEAPTLFAVNRQYNGCEISSEINGNTITISTCAIKVTYIDDGELFSKDSLKFEVFGTRFCYGDKNKENLGGTLSTLDGVSKHVPVSDGLLSKDGWFIIDDTNNAQIVDGWVKQKIVYGTKDFYVFGYGKDYKQALKTLAYISGKVALPRKYVFGSWYSRWWPYTDEEVEKIVDDYDRNDFPLDIMVIDMDWHHNDWTYEDNDEGNKHIAKYGYSHAGNMGWTGYTWNRNLIKNPQKMLDNLHKKNIYVTLNDHPHDGIRTHEDCYDGFMKDMGIDPKSQVNLEFDASDKRYMDNFYKHTHTVHEDNGVDFWWLDWQQDHLKPVVKGTNIKHLPWLNYYYYNKQKRNNKRGQSFSRWGGFGDQKHPIYFSGDTWATWECLKFEVEFTAQSSNSLLFFWGHDTGGFCGQRNDEMYARWTQFTAFSACLRCHSARDDRLDRCPWKWEENAVDSMRKSYHLRSKLMPYIYSSAYISCEETLPFISPMYIEYPEDQNAYNYPTQYMFGPSFICAPITDPLGEDKKASSKVWIKEGAYYNWFTGEKYESGVHEISCGLDTFPLLVKGGSPVVMQPYNSRMTSGNLRKLEIICYPGEKGEFTLYEDDGISQDYEIGKWLKTDITYYNENGNIKIAVKPYGKGFEGMPEFRDYEIILPQTKVKYKTDFGDISYRDSTNYITVKNMGTNESFFVNLKIDA